MFKEFFILIFLLQVSIGKWGSWSKKNLCNTSYKSCKGNTSELAAFNLFGCTYCKICIPSNLSLKEIRKHPASAKSSQTNIYIHMSKVQIIKITENSVIISLNLEVKWIDYRFQVLNLDNNNDQEVCGILESEQKKIWMPQLEIVLEMVSQEKKNQNIYAITLEKQDGAWISNSFYLTTEVMCELDFKIFPFDHHECRLEVKSSITKFKIPNL